MFDKFSAICESCGSKRYHGLIGGPGRVRAEKCGSDFLPHDTEPDARYCEECADAKDVCKFCGASLSAEYERLTKSERTRSAKVAAAPSKGPGPALTMTILILLTAAWLVFELVTH